MVLGLSGPVPGATILPDDLLRAAKLEPLYTVQVHSQHALPLASTWPHPRAAAQELVPESHRAAYQGVRVLKAGLPS